VESKANPSLGQRSKMVSPSQVPRNYSMPQVTADPRKDHVGKEIAGSNAKNQSSKWSHLLFRSQSDVMAVQSTIIQSSRRMVVVRRVYKRTLFSAAVVKSLLKLKLQMRKYKEARDRARR
jgi:hypothetical protein